MSKGKKKSLRSVTAILSGGGLEKNRCPGLLREQKERGKRAGVEVLKVRPYRLRSGPTGKRRSGMGGGTRGEPTFVFPNGVVGIQKGSKTNRGRKAGKERT